MRKLLLLVVLAGCGPDKDWSDKKLVPQTVTNEGATYTISIPDGLPKNKRSEGDWYDARVEYDHIPQVFTSVRREIPDTVEKAKRDVPLSPEKGNFVRELKRPDGGWSFTIVDGTHRIEASSMIKAGDKIINCHAVQVGDDDVPSFDKTKAMLEAICDSLKAP